jgi:hypothetical protein
VENVNRYTTSKQSNGTGPYRELQERVHRRGGLDEICRRPQRQPGHLGPGPCWLMLITSSTKLNFKWHPMAWQAMLCQKIDSCVSCEETPSSKRYHVAYHIVSCWGEACMWPYLGHVLDGTRGEPLVGADPGADGRAADVQRVEVLNRGRGPRTSAPFN